MPTMRGTFGAPRTPPPHPTGAAGSDDDFDERATMVEPPGLKMSPLVVRATSQRPTTSTTETAVVEDSSEILLDAELVKTPQRLVASELVKTPQRLVAAAPNLAAGTGETGSTIDELTMAEEEEQPQAQLAVVRAPPAQQPPPRHGGGARMGGPPADSAASPAWLLVQSGADRGRRFQVKTGRNTIGRGVDNDVVLTDIAVSRRHLIIDCDGALGYVMSDLGSGNGTLVNDRDEEGAFRLSHGDRLELGNTVLVFECAELAARAASMSPPAKGKWTQTHDEEMSTVAGKKPTRPEPNPRPTSQHAAPRALPPRPPAPRTAAMPASEPPHGMHPHGPQMLGGPSPIAMGPSPMPAPIPVSLVRDHSPQVPPAPAHMPTMAADILGIGGPTPMPPHGQPMPPMGSGFSHYGPPGGVQYPQIHGYSSGSGQAPPRFQYPNGVMSSAPAGDRRKLLIGILGIAFVAVSAGIVMALVHGKGDGPAKAPVAAAGQAPTTAPSVPTATPLPTADPLPADPTGTQPAGAQPAGAQPAVTQPAAEAGGGPVRLASLYGEKQLNSAVFGTDEQFLSDQPAAAIADDGDPIKPDDKPKEETKKPKDEGGKKKVAESRPKKTSERIVEEEEEEEEEEETPRPSVDGASARRQANTLYKQKQFSEAASALRRAADSGNKRDAASLRSDASKLEQIGTLISQGEKTAQSDPPKALDAFKKAKRLDEEHGDGTHDGYLGARIAQVAPPAAKSHMVYKRWAEAKRAADDAENYGNDDAVKGVRDSLSRKAEELYDQANELAGSGKNADAADLARQIMKMVPKGSAVYGKASKLAKK
jgi:hypothetical protein